jgi:hypothetical protein
MRAMAMWDRLDCTSEHMGDLIQCGLIRSWITVGEWELPQGDEYLTPPLGYVVSFAHFHECGFTMPPHPFLLELLYYCKIQLHHLNPNRIQHMAIFVALCEGYLGIAPHFEL